MAFVETVGLIRLAVIGDKECISCARLEALVKSERSRGDEFYNLFLEEQSIHDETRHLLYEKVGIAKVNNTNKVEVDYEAIKGYESPTKRAARLSMDSLKKRKEQEKQATN